MLILLLIAVFLLAALALLGWALAGYALRIRPQTLEEARRWQEEHYDLSWYDGLDKEDYTAVADDGYSLHVQRLVNPAGGRGCVIISHGYTDNRLGALKYARNYLDMGLDVSAGLGARTFGLPWFKHFRPAIIDEYIAAFRKVIEHHEELLPGDPGNPKDLGKWFAF